MFSKAFNFRVLNTIFVIEFNPLIKQFRVLGTLRERETAFGNIVEEVINAGNKSIWYCTCIFYPSKNIIIYTF